MQAADFAFDSALHFFLRPDQRGKSVHLTFAEHQTVMHLVEALGVPHVEVGTPTRNGDPIGAAYRPRTGDQIEIHTPSRGCPIDPPRFVLDAHLGRLAAYLRMLGFDSLYDVDTDDADLAAIADNEQRILLSRDRRLLMRKQIIYGYCPRSLDPEEQFVEVVRRYQLAEKIAPLTRCLRCNGLLHSVPKAEVLNRLESLTRQYFDEFAICTACDQVYWQGSHVQRMQALIEKVL